MSSLTSEGNGHLIADTESTDRINRIGNALDRAWSNVISRTIAYQKDFTDEERAEIRRWMIENKWFTSETEKELTETEQDALPYNDNFVLSLKVPLAFPKALAPVIRNDIHDYMVNYALSDWYSFFRKDEAERFAVMADQNLTELKAHLDTRITPPKIRLNPF